MASASNQSQQQPINYSGDAPTATSSNATTKSSVTFDEDLFLFLPRLSDILKRYKMWYHSQILKFPFFKALKKIQAN